jgi:two-component system, OmpR family, response regulator
MCYNPDMKKANILLLEDDLGLSETLCDYLVSLGYNVEAVYDGNEAETALYERRYDLLLLDVNVPGPNGFELLREHRKKGLETPAIYMTTRNGVEDLETGYQSGGDDYLRKPFELKELALRIESMLRRNYYHASDTMLNISDTIRYDTATNTLHVEGKTVALSEKEARLLKLFVQRRGELLVHEVIMEHLYDFDETPSETALRTYIKNLRKLLGKDAIVSHKRLGYQFR